MLGGDCHHPILKPSGIPSAAMVFRILHPILASTRCDASPLARIAGPPMALSRWNVVSTLLRLLSPDSMRHRRFPSRARARMLRWRSRALTDSDASWASFRGGISTRGERSARGSSIASTTPLASYAASARADAMGRSISPTSHATRVESRALLLVKSQAMTSPLNSSTHRCSVG